uniref:Uncharacterized protein n=1 Tax=Arundo donax TaxID=35708 RepID=A0A0A9AAD5_ARUDO
MCSGQAGLQFIRLP